MDTITLLIWIMGAGIVIFSIRWLYYRIYLSKFVLKNKEDINEAFSALVKKHLILEERFHKLQESHIELQKHILDFEKNNNNLHLERIQVDKALLKEIEKLKEDTDE